MRSQVRSPASRVIPSACFCWSSRAAEKRWRRKYRVDGREQMLATGAYPAIGLGEARRRRDDAREAMAAGKDPAREKQRDKVRAKHQAETMFAGITAEVG